MFLSFFPVICRHTGGIKCANSLRLVYTPKRMPLRYKSYKARKQLASIDWNFHINLPVAKGKASGQDLVSRKYNPRTRQWDLKVIKVDKGYESMPTLIAKIPRRRMEDVDYVTRNVSLNESDPAIIAPNNCTLSTTLHG